MRLLCCGSPGSTPCRPIYDIGNRCAGRQGAAHLLCWRVGPSVRFRATAMKYPRLGTSRRSCRHCVELGVDERTSTKSRSEVALCDELLVSCDHHAASYFKAPRIFPRRRHPFARSQKARVDGLAQGCRKLRRERQLCGAVKVRGNLTGKTRPWVSHSTASLAAAGDNLLGSDVGSGDQR